MQRPLNPFFTSPIIPEKYFCDRVKESERMIKLLTNGNNIVLISPRRMGKTGLIRHVYASKEISGRYNTFFVDILHTTSLRELAFTLGKEIFDSLKPQGVKVLDGLLAVVKSLKSKLAYDPLTGLPEFSLQIGDISKPEYTLEEIFSYLESSSKPCLLTIDEFQQIREYSDDINVEAMLRTMIQKMTNCRFVFSGSRRHVMIDMFSSTKRPFYNSADTLALSPINPQTYTSFAVRMFNEYGKSISDEEVLYVYDEFEGCTYNIQKVMNETFFSTPPSSVADRLTVDEAVSTILDSNSITYRELLSTLKERQKQVLAAIAKERQATAVTSEDFISRYSLPSASVVQNALRTLVKNELVYKDGNTYSVYDKFLALWLRRNL